MKPKYQQLKGKTKDDVLEEMGDEFNYFHLDLWTYHIGNCWIWKKKLFIYFVDGTVTEVKIRYGSS